MKTMETEDMVKETSEMLIIAELTTNDNDS